MNWKPRIIGTATIVSVMGVLLSGCMALNAPAVITGDGVSATASVTADVMRGVVGTKAIKQVRAVSRL